MTTIKNDQYTVFNGDCLEFLPAILDETIDLTITSPPYDNIRDYDGKYKLDLPEVGKQLLQKTKDGGICCVIMQDGTKDFQKSLSTFKLAIDWVNSGWKLFECCIYHRHGTPGAWWNQRFRVDHEYILIFFKGERPSFFDKSSLMVPAIYAGQMPYGTPSVRLTNGDLKKQDRKPVAEKKCRGTIWFLNKSSYEKNKIKSKHPATFPNQLVDDLINCFSKENDIICDPFLGSGTTLIQSIKLNRKFIGSEVSQEYFEIIKEQINKLNDTRII